jgi:hypothetical protein
LEVRRPGGFGDKAGGKKDMAWDPLAGRPLSEAPKK